MSIVDVDPYLAMQWERWLRRAQLRRPATT